MDESIKIEIKPGYSIGDVLTYAGKGNEQFTYPRSALKIKLTEDTSVSTNFIRRGNNLIYTHSLSLQAAIAQHPIQFLTLDNRQINLNLAMSITPQSLHKIEGEGMPIDCSRGVIDPNAAEGTAPDMSAAIMPYKKGDLFIKFDIQFPTGIADEKR